ncbi:Carbon monoxide dehydrogenase subunit G (CoxG) [compost metagenome]
MLLKTDSSTVNASAQKVFEFLSDSKNIEHLLPGDKISDFQSDENGCSFKAQGGIVISLLYVSKEPNTKIHMQSGDKAPFSYTLSILLKESGENSCEGHIEFEANINMFMKMMVEKPLTSLFVVMTKNLQKQFD